ncbi:SMC-Scp complex subunit ScpB [Cellulomonas xiejunii]|uniref:SMC-Scp complex subunit ScpB n=1 Tax=Cellulomonas xiejunii TaxID=2968083 RepID=UPI0021046ABC|nr:SMC-Scp complex subunit ScpB [Cellulomonas xiejunii]
MTENVPPGTTRTTGDEEPPSTVTGGAVVDGSFDGTRDEPAPDELAFDVETLPGGALAALEAVLMVVDEPVPAVRLATTLGLPTAHVEELLEQLAAEYRGEHGGRPRGFELRRAADGWRIYSAGAHGDVVGRFVVDGQTQRLTQAALETLAVVAYRQPVSRGQVSAVRGVNVDGVMRTLSTRGLVAEVGQDAATGAVLYGTTGYFLERMGLSSLDELPPLAPYLPDIESMEGIDTYHGREDAR